MARAKRHYIPSCIRHITHRCHKREFLLGFAKDRHRYLQWLDQARKRYGLTILNYMITSNHIHILVADDGGRDFILEGGGGYQLREEDVPYKALLGPKKDDMGPENTYFLDINYE